MQLLLLSPEMLARREDVLNFLAALMPRCVNWSEQVSDSVDVWNKDRRELVVSATSVLFMYMKLHRNPEDRFNEDFLTMLTGANHFLSDGREVHVEDVTAAEMELLHKLDFNLPDCDRDDDNDDYVGAEGRAQRDERHEF